MLKSTFFGYIGYKGHLQSQFLPKIWIYMQLAISTKNQGPRSKKKERKHRGKKSRVSVPIMIPLIIN